MKYQAGAIFIPRNMNLLEQFIIELNQSELSPLAQYVKQYEFLYRHATDKLKPMALSCQINGVVLEAAGPLEQWLSDYEPLNFYHLEMLAVKSAISFEVIVQNGAYSLPDDDQAEAHLVKLGFPIHQIKAMCPRPGLVLPCHGVFGGPPQIFVYRPDNPPEFEDKRVTKGNGEYKRNIIKYVWPKDASAALYIPPASYKRLNNAKLPIYWTEGQKKTDALVSQGLCAIGLPNGVWGWKSNGVKTDIDALPLKDREHVILFDHDAATNPQVGEALERFSAQMERRHGTEVVVGIVPALDGPHGVVKGVDDWFAAGFTLRTLTTYIEAGRHLYQKETKVQSGKPVSRDYQEAFEKLGYDFQYNEAGFTFEMNREPMDEPKEAQMKINLLDHGTVTFEQGGFSDRRIDLEWKAAAHRQRYHPIRDYLEKCLQQWDGVKGRLDLLCSHFTDSNEVEYRKAFPQHGKYEGHETLAVFLKKWLIGIPGKLFDQKQNMMLIFVGKKGMGKSFLPFFLANGLGAGKFYTEQEIKPADKDYQRRATALMIWEAPEIGGMLKVQVEEMKRFLTQRYMRFRPPYHKSDLSEPSICSFFGTVNYTGVGFLPEETENDRERRYWPVSIEEINHDYSQLIDVNQLWGEIMNLYREGATNKLTDEEVLLMNVIVERYATTSIYQDYLEQWFGVCTDPKEPLFNSFVATTSIIGRFRDEKIVLHDRALENEIAKAMYNLGGRRGRVSNTGPRGYFGAYNK